MEKLITILVVIVGSMVTVSNYPDAVEGAHVLYNDLFGEE